MHSTVCHYIMSYHWSHQIASNSKSDHMVLKSSSQVHSDILFERHFEALNKGLDNFLLCFPRLYPLQIGVLFCILLIPLRADTLTLLNFNWKHSMCCHLNQSALWSVVLNINAHVHLYCSLPDYNTTTEPWIGLHVLSVVWSNGIAWLYETYMSSHLYLF